MKAWTTKHWSKATLVGMIGLFALAGPVRAGSAESRFADGNRAWLAGDYAGAIQCYEAIAQQEGISPGLLHHLARAYQANGDLGRARLTFERARWLAPRDANIRADLHHLRRELGLPVAEGARWTRPFLLLSMNEWIWLGAAAWAAFGGLILARGLGVKRLPYMTGLVVSGTLLAMGLSGTSVRWAQMDQAVVLGEQASVRVSPYAAAREVTVVSQGQTLTVIGSHGAFLKVRTADGQTGWMAATHISRLTGLDFTIPEHGAEVVSAGNRARDAGSEG